MLQPVKEIRIAELQAQIDFHQNLYDNPDMETEISDPEFDQLKIELQQLSPADPRLFHVAGVSPGAAEFQRRKVSHAHNPCFSLDKVYSFADILKFAEKVARNDDELFDLEVKLDGLTGSLTDGVLATSGEGGLIGFDISDKLAIIEIVHAPGSENITKDLRGELVIKKSVFQQNKHLFIRKGGEPYKIPRSACVGQIMQETHITEIGKFVTFVVFGKFQKTLSLRELKTFDWEKAAANTQNNFDYPADGLVLKLHDREYLASLGATSHHRKGEMAFKFANPTGDTVLLAIERSVGKRSITPVGIIEPVEIGGVMNSRISLHNKAYIAEHDLCVGDKISVARCGDIIPQLSKVLERPADRYLPDMDHCPACGEPTEFDETSEWCRNDNCSGTGSRLLYDAVVRVDIENLGLSTVEKMMNQGVKTLIDVFSFSREHALRLEGFAELSAKNLLAAIAAVKNCPVEDWKILSSLNIQGIGRRMSKKILADRTIADLQEMSTPALSELDGIGHIRAGLIHVTLVEQKEYLTDLIALFPSMINSVDQKAVLKGKVCFTGKTPDNTGSRDKFWKPLAEQSGYEMAGSVTKDVSFLVTNDPSSTSSKMKKARDLGVQIMDYEAFQGLCAADR